MFNILYSSSPRLPASSRALGVKINNLFLIKPQYGHYMCSGYVRNCCMFFDMDVISQLFKFARPIACIK